MTLSTSTDRRKKSEIYRKAAKVLEESVSAPGCCWAIAKIDGLGYDYSVCGKLFAECFRQGAIAAGSTSPHWMRLPGEEDYQEVKDRRVLALCFMAEIVETGDA